MSDGKQLQKKEPQTVLTIISKMKTEIARALPKHMTPDRMLRIALTEVRKNPALELCDPMSFAGALVQCSQLGLEPGSGLGQAYLIPFRNRRLGISECQFIVGYRGYLELARRSGLVSSVWSTPVFKSDEFEWLEGTDRRIPHKPSGDWNPDELTHAYAVVKYNDGSTDFEVLTRQRIDRIRDMKPQNQVWTDHYIEMARKTAIRALAKRLPLSPELATAIEVDDKAGEGQENWQVIDADYQPAPAHDADKFASIANDDSPVDQPDSVQRKSENDRLDKLAPFVAAFDACKKAGGDPGRLLGSAYDRIMKTAKDSDIAAAIDILERATPAE